VNLANSSVRERFNSPTLGSLSRLPPITARNVDAKSSRRPWGAVSGTLASASSVAFALTSDRRGCQVAEIWPVFRDGV
jgi:hypothetical protein